MKKVFTTLLFFSLLATLPAQHLYLEAFTGLNKSDYKNPQYLTKASNLNVGARLAAGTDHFQIGAEYNTNLTRPTLDVSDNGVTTGTDTYSENYIGGFLRTKISKFPAQRFGLVLMAGGGVYTSSVEVQRTGAPGSPQQFDYKQYPGFNGSVGFSIPVSRRIMLELAYSYHLVTRPELPPYLPEYNASYHCFSAGASLNLVFGKRAQEYPPFRGK
jgi:hypothetical protein